MEEIFGHRLVLWATGIKQEEVVKSVQKLTASEIDAVNANVYAKSFEVPVQLFLSATVGFFTAVLKRYLDKRVELEAGRDHELDEAEAQKQRLQDAAQAFAKTVLEGLPERTRQADAHVSIGFAQHGPFGVHLSLDTTNEQEAIDRIAWFSLHAAEVERAIDALRDAGRQNFGNFTLKAISDDEFALTWIEFEPAHQYRAVYKAGLPLAVQNKTIGDTNLITFKAPTLS